jgi:hypothetical protein
MLYRCAQMLRQNAISRYDYSIHICSPINSLSFQVSKPHEIAMSGFVILLNPPRSCTHPMHTPCLIHMLRGARGVGFDDSHSEESRILKSDPCLPLVVHGLVLKSYTSRGVFQRNTSGSVFQCDTPRCPINASQTTSRVPVASRQAACMLPRERHPSA